MIGAGVNVFQNLFMISGFLSLIGHPAALLMKVENVKEEKRHWLRFCLPEGEARPSDPSRSAADFHTAKFPKAIIGRSDEIYAQGHVRRALVIASCG